MKLLPPPFISFIPRLTIKSRGTNNASTWYTQIVTVGYFQPAGRRGSELACRPKFIDHRQPIAAERAADAGRRAAGTCRVTPFPVMATSMYSY